MSCAGIGKTTLAHEICLRWARDGFLSEDFDAVVLIPMRCVQQKSLEEVIIEYIEEEAYQQLKKSAGSRCLIILEGIDEMAADRQKSDRFFIRLIKDCAVLEEATIVITSRPHACDKLNADRQIEVIGFGANEIKKFIEKSFPNDEPSVIELLQQLGDYPHLYSLCYVPLNMVMVVNIFQYSEKKLPSTLTELYKLFIVMILQREVEKEGKEYMSSDVSLTAANSENLKEILPDIPISAIGIVFLLCRLSFCGFFNWFVDMKEMSWLGREKKWKDPKIIFTMGDLIQCGIEVTSQFDGFGLLKATHIHKLPKNTSAYNFSHLTIQEFLCSLYISLLPQQEQKHLMNEHFHDFPNVFAFLCGLTKLKCNEMFQLVYSKLTSEGDDVVYAVRCLHESNICSPQVLPFALDMSFKTLLPYDCYCLSYVLLKYAVSQLKMQWCQIGDNGVEVLTKHFSSDCTNGQLLELIDLKRNDLTADGMKYVMKIVRTSEPHVSYRYTELTIVC